MIEHVVRSLKRCPIDALLVVLGHRHEEIEPVLAPLDVHIVLNPDYARGMLSSVQAGVTAAPPETAWFLIHPVDHPHVDAEVVRRLLAAARAGQGSIVVPSYQRRRGHPLLLSARYRDEIATLSPEVGLRELLRHHPEEVTHLEVDTDAVLRDMDTPDDYRRERPQFDDRA
ncbi:MAG: nucleotidyltransferase family protein [Armatimonadetes bacterium]|nr:nucleotidyltransferase family protein [Armatimonadota bacterium]